MPGECPQGAIRIVEKEAQDFDEEATQGHLNKKPSTAAQVTCHCPGSAVKELTGSDARPTVLQAPEQESTLSHWPVQLALVPPSAGFLKGKDVVLIADCVPFAYPNLHRDFLKDRSVLVACPKLDDFAAHQAKLTAILQNAGIKSLTVVHMEVPCCSGLAYMAHQAMAASGIKIPFREVNMGIHGDIKAATGAVI